MAFSTYLADAVLAKILLGTAFSSNPVYISLHTGDPGITGANEVVGGSYARANAGTDWSVPASKSASTTADKTFASMPACTVTHIGIWDDPMAGNFLLGGPLTSSKTFSSGDLGTLASGDGVATLT